MWDCSSPTRDRTHVPGIGRQILNHWAIKRSLCSFLNVCLSLAVLGPRCCRDSLVAARRGYSLVSVLGLLIASLLLVRGFRCWLPGARAKAQQLWHPGMAAPWHMGSSQDQGSNPSPELAGRLFITEPSGKPSLFIF